MVKKEKRYLIEVQETTGTLDGRPRVAGTRLSLELFAKKGIRQFIKDYPYVKIFELITNHN